MKSTILKTVSAVMLSVLLAASVVPCQARAAAGDGSNACRHFSLTERYVGKNYFRAGDTQHQVRDYYIIVCNDCNETLYHLYRNERTEYHTFGPDQKCTGCGYYHY